MIVHVVVPESTRAHRWRVTLTVPRPAAFQRVTLPAWIPGSYLVREFVRHLSGLEATQGGRPVPLRQLDKATWEAVTAGDEPLEIRYAVYAFDTSVRASFLDPARGFFNGTSLLLRVEGRTDGPQALELRGLPDGWSVATTLPAVDVDARGQGRYQAADYDELADHPVELGTFWRGRFEACGVPHEYVVTGALPDFDGDRLLADVQRICAEQIPFWQPGGGAPFERYLFLHQLVEEGHGGLEHRSSTALISPRREMPSLGREEASDGYVNLLGLVSHEYFHAWNVKRLRPAEFARFDYAAENYTRLLWFFEGFTSYYDDVFLLRAGRIDAARYLKLVSRTLASVLAAPGRKVQSVAEASFDAWIKYYRADENTTNATISYYTKGALVALAFDLTLRAEGRGTLDDVMRRLWVESAGGPVDEGRIAAALEAVGGRSFASELRDWVHGREDPPWRSLLAAMGVDWSTEPTTLAQRLGVRVAESALTGVKVQQVLTGGAGEAAGLAPGDELLAVDGWRVRRLDEATRLVPDGAEATLTIARDQRVSTLTARMPEGEGAGVGIVLKLVAEPDAGVRARRVAWLGA